MEVVGVPTLTLSLSSFSMDTISDLRVHRTAEAVVSQHTLTHGDDLTSSSSIASQSVRLGSEPHLIRCQPICGQNFKLASYSVRKPAQMPFFAQYKIHVIFLFFMFIVFALFCTLHRSIYIFIIYLFYLFCCFVLFCFVFLFCFLFCFFRE